MSQSSEQIEAKLCAYLEGELDEQGRAEIEKHLAGNLAHRKLLAEVARTRDLVRALPRESAPPDICEAFQGHLERAVLLDDAPSEASRSAMRIGSWRPFFAIAALVVLALGLGLVVYFGLPSGIGQQHRYAAGPSPVQSGTNEAKNEAAIGRNPAVATTESAGAFVDAEAQGKTQVAEVDGIKLDRERMLKDVVATGATAPAPDGNTTVAMGPPSQQSLTTSLGTASPASQPAALLSLPALAQQVPRLWSPEQQRQLFFAWGRSPDGLAAGAGGANAPMYLVVAAAEPASTAHEITQELAKLNLEWRDVNAPQPVALRDAAADKLSAAGASGTRGMARADEPGGEPESRVLQKQADSFGATPRAGTASKAGRTESESKAPLSARPQRPAPSPTAGVEATPEKRSQPAPTARRLQPPGQTANAPADDQSPASAAGQASPDTAERLILVRNITRKEAATLRESLGAGGADRQVTVWGETGPLSAGRELNQQIERRRSAGTVADAAASATAPVASPAPADAPSANVAGAPGAPAASAPASAAPGQMPAGGVAAATPTQDSGASSLQGVLRARSATAAAGGAPGARGGFAEAPSPGAGGPTAARALSAGDDVIRRGDSLQLVLAEDGSQSVSEVKVATDGSINLPDVGVFRCEGLTVNQLRERLADKYRAANKPGADDLVVARLAGRSAGGAADNAADLDVVAQAEQTPIQRGRVQMRKTAEVQQRQGNGSERYARADGSRESETTLEAAKSAPVRKEALAEEGPDAALRQQPAESQPSAASTAPASADEERVDLVIVVRRADAGAGSATAAAPAEPEPTSPIAKYEYLSLTLGDGDAAGAEEPDVTNVQVAEDGTIEVPQVGRLKAEGRTSADLERELGETLAKKKANAKVKVSRLGGANTNAATQPEPAPAGPAAK